MYLQDYYHEQAVQSIDVQNSTLASGSYDSKVQARNMEMNVKLFEVAHNGPVYCVKLVGNRLVGWLHLENIKLNVGLNGLDVNINFYDILFLQKTIIRDVSSHEI